MAKHEIELESGAKGVIVCLPLSDDTCPTDSFLDSLSDRAVAQFRARFERLTEVGYLRSPAEWRRLDDGGVPPVYEIKTRDGYRLFVIIPRLGLWVATHGCKKPKPRQLPKEIAKARKYFEEWTPS